MYNEDGVVQEIIKEHELGHPGETKPSEIAMIKKFEQSTRALRGYNGKNIQSKKIVSLKTPNQFVVVNDVLYFIKENDEYANSR